MPPPNGPAATQYFSGAVSEGLPAYHWRQYMPGVSFISEGSPGGMCLQNARQSSFDAYWAWSPVQCSCICSQYFAQETGGMGVVPESPPPEPSKTSTGSESREMPPSVGVPGKVDV